MDKAIARSSNNHGKRNHSNRRELLYEKRRKVHARIVQVRNDNHHKATTAIAKCSGRVGVETLNLSGMLRNRRLARSIVDAGMSGFLAKLEYKRAWYGAEFVKAEGARLREGRANTARGAAHFLRETLGRVRYAGARS